MSILNFGVKGKFAVLLCVVLGAFGTIGAIANSTINRVKVGGPVYAEIITGKDLVADILPPPEYIIESYLTALQLTTVTDTAECAALEAKLAQLQNDFENRHAYWTEHLTDGPMKQSLLATCSDPAREFYTLARDRMLPLLASHKRDEALTLYERRDESSVRQAP